MTKPSIQLVLKFSTSFLVLCILFYGYNLAQILLSSTKIVISNPKEYSLIQEKQDIVNKRCIEFDPDFDKKSASNSQNFMELDELCDGPFIPAYLDRSTMKSLKLDRSNKHKMNSIAQYKLGLCHTPKSGSEAFNRALSLINFDSNYPGIPTRENEDAYVWALDKYAVDHRRYVKMTPWPPEVAFRDDSQWINIFLIRHPIARFASAYGDICQRRDQCDGLDKYGLATFVQKMYRMLLDISKGIELHDKHIFRDNLHHFYPSTWFCSGLTAARLEYFHILRQDSGNFSEEFIDILKTAHFPENVLQDIRMLLDFLAQKDLHSTATQNLVEELIGDKNILNCMYKIFFSNANVTGYDLFKFRV